MSKKEDFIKHILEGYSFKGESIILGGALLEGETLPYAPIKIPLKILNCLGLIARPTGTGKTKTMQVLSKQVSSFGIAVLMMDTKGDFSGIAKKGEEKSFITERHANINIPYHSSSFPDELVSVPEQNGVRLRATVSEFEPVLFSRILNLNDMQAGVVSLICKYCDDHKMPFKIKSVEA